MQCDRLAGAQIRHDSVELYLGDAVKVSIDLCGTCTTTEYQLLSISVHNPIVRAMFVDFPFALFSLLVV